MAMFDTLRQVVRSLRTHLMRLYRLNSPAARRGIWRPLGVAWLDRPMEDFNMVRLGVEPLARHHPCRRIRLSD